MAKTIPESLNDIIENIRNGNILPSTGKIQIQQLLGKTYTTEEFNQLMEQKGVLAKTDNRFNTYIPPESGDPRIGEDKYLKLYPLINKRTGKPEENTRYGSDFHKRDYSEHEKNSSGNFLDYTNDVQKMISYKGIIRPMTLKAKNKYGGTYLLKVLNIYVKPNSEKFEYKRDESGELIKEWGINEKTGKPYKRNVKYQVLDKQTGKPVMVENTRIYEEKPYKIDKKAIAGGSASQGYYPDKAMWSKKAYTEDNIIDIKDLKMKERKQRKSDSSTTLRKRKVKTTVLKRLKHKKPVVKKSKCRCIKKR